MPDEVTTLVWSKKLPVSKRGPDKPKTSRMPVYWAYETVNRVYYHRLFTTPGHAENWCADHRVDDGEGLFPLKWVTHTEEDRQRRLAALASGSELVMAVDSIHTPA